MQKPLTEIAQHLTKIILSDMLNTYIFIPMFEEEFRRENIQKGIHAHRKFLLELYDYLTINGDKFDKPKKIAHPFADRVSLLTNYPFLRNMENVLTAIADLGEFDDNNTTLTINTNYFRTIMEKTPMAKIAECIGCLREIGFHITGIDLSNPVRFFPKETFQMTHTNISSIFIGFKIMTKAKRIYEGKDIYGIFLRCDYRFIVNEEIDTGMFLKDMMRSLPQENQEYINRMHHKYIAAGFTCKISIVDEMCLRFFYIIKSKEVWSIIVSANNGFELAVRAKHTDSYPEIVSSLHPYLQEKIKKGYGCDKKRNPNSYCQGGCKGYRISLTESLDTLQTDLMIWIDNELLFI